MPSQHGVSTCRRALSRSRAADGPIGHTRRTLTANVVRGYGFSGIKKNTPDAEVVEVEG
jgi:hypothetical protein